MLATLSGDASATASGEVIVPLVGFHMPAEEIELDGVRIVRAANVDDLPLEGLELSRLGPQPEERIRCPGALRRRLGRPRGRGRRRSSPRPARDSPLQPGAVGLAPHGWVRRAEGWERFATGANRPRHGGYRLTGTETAELEEFARTLASRGARTPALDWAISRFDLGAERPSLIEALSDYLLALRGLLEGGGPARAALGARVGALVAAGEERDRARQSVERALAIERKLMSGSRFVPTAEAQPLKAIAEVEELLRALLRRMIVGELGGDLRAAADEVLLSDGLGRGRPPRRWERRPNGVFQTPQATRLTSSGRWMIPRSPRAPPMPVRASSRRRGSWSITSNYRF